MVVVGIVLHDRPVLEMRNSGEWPLFCALLGFQISLLVLGESATRSKWYRWLLGYSLMLGTGFYAIHLKYQCFLLHIDDNALGWWAPAVLLALGGAVAGVGLTTMLLGHSYLVHADLSFEHLVRMSRLFIASILARCALLLVVLFSIVGVNDLWTRLHRQMQEDLVVGLLPIVRVVVGLIFPLILGFMVHSCAKIRANRSATGIMYVATAFVVIGELCSFFLMFRTPFPL